MTTKTLTMDPMNKNLKDIIRNALMKALKTPLKEGKRCPKKNETSVENKIKNRNEIPEDIQLTITLCAFGIYQAQLLWGEMAWSGKDVGPSYASGYRNSRRNLLKRIRDKLPDGWTADLKLVAQDEKRPRKQLIINDLFGNEYVW